MNKAQNNPVGARYNLDQSSEAEVTSISQLHLMNENTKIYDQKVTIYGGLQFDVQDKTLSEKASKFINNNAPKAKEQIGNIAKWGFRGVMGIVKHAGNFVIGNVSDLGQYIQKQRQEKYEKEELERLEEQKQIESIDENWEFIIKGKTPQELLEQLEKSGDTQHQQIKIIRISNAIKLDEVNKEGQIIQLENSESEMKKIINDQQFMHRSEFEMLESSFFELRGALQASIDESEFNNNIKLQNEIAKNNNVGWEFVVNQQDKQILENNNNNNPPNQPQAQQEFPAPIYMENIFIHHPPTQQQQQEYPQFLNINQPQLNIQNINTYNYQQPQQELQELQDYNYNHQNAKNNNNNNFQYNQEANQNYVNNNYNQQYDAQDSEEREAMLN